MTSQFGNIFSSHQLQNQAKITLKKWFPTYLRHVESVYDITSKTLPNPENYSTSNSFDATSGEKLPKVVVISPGILGSPYKKGKRQYGAVWSLGVGIAMAAENEELAVTYDKLYGLAAKLIMLQQLGGECDFPVADILWLDENYDDLPIPAQSRFYRAIGLYFSVDVEDVVSGWTGPTVPDQDSYADLGLAQTVEVELEKVDVIT